LAVESGKAGAVGGFSTYTSTTVVVVAEGTTYVPTTGSP
jgi:hypothetical protein